MKFTTAILATALLAATATATPLAEVNKRDPVHHRYSNWCIGPGQVCMKSKRDLDSARAYLLAGQEIPEQHWAIPVAEDTTAPVEKRDPVHHRYSNWCVGPGQVCMKSKRDLEDARKYLVAGEAIPEQLFADEAPEGLAKREPGIVRHHRYSNWCVGPGQVCMKSKRDLEDAKAYLVAGQEIPGHLWADETTITTA